MNGYSIEDSHRIQQRAAQYRQRYPQFANWAKGRGVIEHTDLTQVRVFDLTARALLQWRLKAADVWKRHTRGSSSQKSGVHMNDLADWVQVAAPEEVDAALTSAKMSLWFTSRSLPTWYAVKKSRSTMSTLKLSSVASSPRKAAVRSDAPMHAGTR